MKWLLYTHIVLCLLYHYNYCLYSIIVQLYCMVSHNCVMRYLLCINVVLGAISFLIVICDVFCAIALLCSCTVWYALCISLYCYLLPALFRNHTVNNTFYTNGLRILDGGYITNLPGTKLPIKINQGNGDVRKRMLTKGQFN